MVRAHVVGLLAYLEDQNGPYPIIGFIYLKLKNNLVIYFQMARSSQFRSQPAMELRPDDE